MNRVQNTVIQDARVLTAEYLPNKMVHREGERQEIARNLRPVLNDEQPNNMLLYGKPGTGKTAMAKYVVEELQKEKFIKSSYVNCFSEKSRFEIFYKLLDQKITTPRDGTSTEKVFQKFKSKTKEQPTVVIIDELDQISDDDIPYELSRLQNVGIIFIANDRRVFSHFEERVRSRLSGLKEIRFKRYSPDEIRDILKRRRKYGLREGSIEDADLEKIAENAGGDARVALNALRLAAREAEAEQKQKIPEEIVENSISDAYDEERINSLERLNSHQKTIYKILQQEDELKMGELYRKYRTKVDSPKTRRTLRRYLGKMEAYNVVNSRGDKSGKKYSLTD